MHYLLLAIPLLIAGWYALSLILALAEKDHVRNDLIPGSLPASWKSDFLEKNPRTPQPSAACTAVTT